MVEVYYTVRVTQREWGILQRKSERCPAGFQVEAVPNLSPRAGIVRYGDKYILVYINQDPNESWGEVVEPGVAASVILKLKENDKEKKELLRELGLEEAAANLTIGNEEVVR